MLPEEMFLLGLLWGCFVTALLLKRKAIKQICCDTGAKISSTSQLPYPGYSEDPSHLETEDHDANMQAAIEDSINDAEDLEPCPPRAAHTGAGAGPSNSSDMDIELAEMKPTAREL